MPELSLSDVFTSAGLATLLQVILIDLTMAGDNVVIMGTIASGLPAKDRRRVIMFGVAMALVFLIGFALAATWLLHLTGLLLAGGLLLLWGAYNMYRELRTVEVVLLAGHRKRDAASRADIDAGVALDAFHLGEHRLNVAVQASLSFFVPGQRIEP